MWRVLIDLKPCVAILAVEEGFDVVDFFLGEVAAHDENGLSVHGDDALAASGASSVLKKLSCIDGGRSIRPFR